MAQHLLGILPSLASHVDSSSLSSCEHLWQPRSSFALHGPGEIRFVESSFLLVVVSTVSLLVTLLEGCLLHQARL